MSTERLRLGILGIGRWGRQHLRVAQTFPDVDVKTCDPKIASADFATVSQMLAWRPQAIIIATPIPTHALLAHLFLTEGIHVLVEKPMATDAELAESLLVLARRNGLVLHVGHVTLYEAAVRFVKNLLDDEVTAGTFWRSGPRPHPQANVVDDLMCHDVATAIWLGLDLGACIFTAKYQSERVREWKVAGFHCVDGNLSCEGVDRIVLPPSEPLRMEQEDFLSRVRLAVEGKFWLPGAVSGELGLRVVRYLDEVKRR